MAVIFSRPQCVNAAGWVACPVPSASRVYHVSLIYNMNNFGNKSCDYRHIDPQIWIATSVVLPITAYENMNEK